MKPRQCPLRVLAGVLVSVLIVFAHDARGASTSIEQCHEIADTRARLQCYDLFTGYRKPDVVAGNTLAPTSPPATKPYLEEAWALNDPQSIPLTRFAWHRPTYLIGRATSNVNQMPQSPTHPAAGTPRDDDSAEMKFQISLKAELVSPQAFRDLFNTAAANPLHHSRLWFAYTQQSNWQAFNRSNSRPFRENDYEPELIWTYDHSHAGSVLKLVNLGYVHLSNGQSGADSRSWDRVYVQGGWEWQDRKLSVLARTWWRLPVARDGDDNPDIKNYYGRGDMVVRWEPNEDHKFSLLLRHNLRVNPGRGFAQLDWSTPLKLGQARVHVQASSGYGETLIDYNHNQTTLGVGLSFGKW